MKNFTFLIGLFVVFVMPNIASADQANDQKMLKRLYEMRMRLDRDRMQADNEARANVRLVTQRGSKAADSPTVTQMRRDMQFHLAQFANNFRCLDVDVENNGGNTVVICGDNNGSVHGENTIAGDDIVTFLGGNR